MDVASQNTRCERSACLVTVQAGVTIALNAIEFLHICRQEVVERAEKFVEGMLKDSAPSRSNVPSASSFNSKECCKTRRKVY